jgi:uridine kinase
MQVNWESLKRDVAAARATGNLVVLEGHVVVTVQELADLAGFAVVLDEKEETCRARRLGRRARPEADNAILERYIREVVWPAYNTYGRPAQDALETRLDLMCIRLSKLNLSSEGGPEAVVRAAVEALAGAYRIAPAMGQES